MMKSFAVSCLDLLIVFCLPLTPVFVLNDFAFGVEFGKLAWCAIFGVLSAFRIISRLQGASLVLHPVAWWACVYVLYCMISCFSLNPVAISNKLLCLILSCNFLLYFQLIVSRSNEFTRLLNTMFYSFSIATTYIVGVALLQNIGVVATYNASFPFTGTFFHPAVFSGYLSAVSLLYIGVSIYLSLRKLYQSLFFISLVVAILCLLGLLLTGNRAAILGFCSGLSLVLYFFYHKSVSRMLRLAGSYKLAVLAAILFFFLFCLFRIRPDSVLGRILVWKITSGIIAENFFSGIGTDNFKRVYPNYQVEYFKGPSAFGEEAILSSEVSYVFNEFLHIWAETGVIGICFFLLFLYNVYSTTLSGVKPDAAHTFENAIRIGAIGGTISLLVYSFFSYPFSTISLTVVFFVLIAISCGRFEVHATKGFNLPLSRLLVYCVLFFSFFPVYKMLGTGKILYSWNVARLAVANRSSPATKIELFENLSKDRILASNPAFISQYAQILMEAEDFRGASRLFEKRNQLQLSYEDLMKLGYCYRVTGRRENAIATFESAFYLLPHKFSPLSELMELSVENGDTAEAKRIAALILRKKVKKMSVPVIKFRERAHDVLSEK